MFSDNMDRIALCNFNMEDEETKTNFRTLDKKTMSANKRERNLAGLVSNAGI